MNTIENAKEIISSYKRDDGKKLRIMEVCGTHTHEIFRLGIRKLLPESVELISGPGCPVCVTPIGFIDEACMLALEKGAVICTFGDLIRVPGTEMSLAGARSKGATIKTVYSPLDAVSYAESHRDEQVVFLAVGFETTTPSACLAVEKAIPMSGMILRDEYADFDARKKFALPKITGKPNPACRCGDVLQGKCKPSDCKVFGKVCTPLHPIGACMVSNEGACSAYYQYGNL